MFKRVQGKKTAPEPIKTPAPAARQQPTPAAAPTSAPRPAAQGSAPAAAPQNAPSPSGRNVLSSDVEIKGSIKFSNDLVVDGKIDGEIISNGGSLTVGENARISASIKTRSVVIYGKVYGNIEVSHNVELKANCELVGDIKAASLSIEPGSIFVGKSTVGKPTATPQPAAKPAQNTPVQQPIQSQQPVKSSQPAPAAGKPQQQPTKPEQPKLPKQAQQELAGLKKPAQQKDATNKAPQSFNKGPQSIKRP